MNSTASGRARNRPYCRSRERLHLFLLLLLPAAAGWPGQVAAADGSNPGNKPKQAVVPVREYLPVLLQKSLLKSDQAYLKRLQAVLALFRGLQEAGDISQGQINDTKRQVLRTRIQILRRQKAYADSLDRSSFGRGTSRSVCGRRQPRWSGRFPAISGGSRRSLMIITGFPIASPSSAGRKRRADCGPSCGSYTPRSPW
jgi:hypothetical protein